MNSQAGGGSNSKQGMPGIRPNGLVRPSMVTARRQATYSNLKALNTGVD
jgi:hypothetical protein